MVDSGYITKNPLKVYPVNNINVYLLAVQTDANNKQELADIKYFTNKVDALVLYEVIESNWGKEEVYTEMHYVLCRPDGRFSIVEELTTFLCVQKEEDDISSEFLDKLIEQKIKELSI